MKFTDEQETEARDAVRSYEARCEMMWGDMKFELEMRLGLSSEHIEELLEKVQ